MESAWSARCSAAGGAEWFRAEGGKGGREEEAAAEFAKQLGAPGIPRVIEEMMDAAAYGYAPMEVIWAADGGVSAA